MVLGGVEIFVVVTVLGLLAAAWTYRDASRRGVDNALLWALAIGFLFLLYGVPGAAAFIVYLALRSKLATPEA